MKYKTFILSYPESQSENKLIASMASFGWGLIHVLRPDVTKSGYGYNGYYTFAGGDDAVDVENDFINGIQPIEK